MSAIAWFADNWLKLLIALIVVGVLADWLVWMARWRPYWVWFRKRRILLDNNVDEFDDDDMMLRYGDVSGVRARRDSDEYRPRRDGYDQREYEGARGHGRDEYRHGDYDEDGYDGYDEGGYFDPDYDEDAYDPDDYRDDRGRYDDEDDVEDDVEDSAEDFDALYDDPPALAGAEAPEGSPGPGAPAEEADEDDDLDTRTARAAERRSRLFVKKREKKRAEEDPFSIEGDFFDDLGEDPMDDVAWPRAADRHEPDAQDTSIYKRPLLLPGDEPGAVRGANEEAGWHSGYTQRSAERKRRRKQDTRA